MEMNGQKNLKTTGLPLRIQSEGIGYDDGVEVNGWAKANESIGKWKIIPTKKAVDFPNQSIKNGILILLMEA